MEGLTAQDWSLIARCLKDEATSFDLVQLNGLLNEHPSLKERLTKITDEINKPSPYADKKEFDANEAFQKLHSRLKKENLI